MCSSDLVAYALDSKFTVYSKVSSGSLGEVSTSLPLVGVYDTSGNLLMLTLKKSDLVFRGYSEAANLPLTTVGSSGQYRGAVGIAGTTALTPYNAVMVEDYLYGVVPREMPSSWPIEALKAQAVAARSIAAFQYNRYLTSGYNVVDTTSTQAYGGYGAETVATTSAVNATKGEVVRYNGSIAETLYFSTSGGITEAAQDVWGNPVAYLQSVIDTYETEPAAPAWTRTFTLSDLDAGLARLGADIGSATGISISERSATGRVKKLTIIGTNGTRDITGDAVRSFFSPSSGGSLRSTYFSFNGPVSDSLSTSTTTTSPSTVMVLSADGVSEVRINGLEIGRASCRERV